MTIAHRGDPLVHRENTLPSLQSAVDKGANTLEFDLRLTRDGQIVLLHDASLERLWGVPGQLADHTLSDLRQLTQSDLRQRDLGGYRLPLFEEVLAAFPETTFLVDLKTDDVVAPAVRTLREFGGDAFERSIFVAARKGGREALIELRRNEPDAVIGLDWTAAEPPAEELLDTLRPQYFGPRWAVADAAGVPAMRERGYRVWVGPLADPGQVADALAYGVDGIVADDISDLLARCAAGAGAGAPGQGD
ncbi:glycerophosphodiester phosphodiesterase [Micromonospora zhanjiangensis]|uniref:Glycerophosphodiester phosphodiesterase n=1 Tax=Micromonospora zhanjiangensis TaxID=1522057 RepID=A0ABV8KRH1_9ACTN